MTEQHEEGQHRLSFTTYTGTRGTVTRLRIDPDMPNATTTIGWWLLEGNWHPFWNQFVLCSVHLRNEKGAPEPNLKFPEATHEIMVLALNPERGRRTPSDLEEHGFGSGAWLTPIDFIEQFTATDEEVYELLDLLAHGVADGRLNPSTDDARERIRNHWRTSITKTLAHMRGEEHSP